MKYKVLLTGENKSAIDDFFLHMQDEFESITTSSRNQDILKHLEVFQPDIFVYCINGESVKDFNKIYKIKEKLEKNNIPLAIIGSEEECRIFERVAVNTADIVLLKALVASVIAEKINEFLEMRKRDEETKKQEEEEKRRETEEMEEISQQQEKRRYQILVVDDDPRMLKLVSKQLNKNYDVATAISGKLAMKFLERKQTDLILLDYEMPGENGPTVLKMLRDDPETKDIPVVFLTGMTEKRKIQEVLLMKPQGYLLKPINIEKLYKVITDVLGE